MLSLHIKIQDMTPFLRQVADHYHKEGDIRRNCFIFPNRRSMIFFRRYLCEIVAQDGSVPVVAPQMLTINDFFFKAAGARATDRVRLLLDLYDCYKELNPKAESLDEFIFWGDVILGDFNDVDKYLVDPVQLFRNISDYKEIQDDYAYLSPAQKEAVNAFIRHFRDDSGRLTVNLDTDDPDVKGRFLQIWNIILPLYERFRASLDASSRAYEGMVYRKLAELLRVQTAEDVFGAIFPDVARFVFVGLNALNECEKTVLRKLRDASVAEFCWDWSGDMILDPQNRASFFMSDNVKEFPQAFRPDPEGLVHPAINVVSVPSAVGQAKRLPDIVRQIADMQTEGVLSKVGTFCDGGTDCAVVLPDENLLKPVLNSIPEEITDINVTMGLPMKSSLIYVLMSDLASVQLNVTDRKGQRFFYHQPVWNVFSSEIFRRSADEATLETVSRIRKEARYYISQNDLAATPLLEVLFRPVLDDVRSRSKEQIYAFAGYQMSVLKALAPGLARDGAMALELEYAKEYYRSLNMIRQIGLEVLPQTYIRLLGQILGAVSVPFRGEPLKGLQIMGPLETRALDFRNLIIMSSNEGVFPRRNVSSSFIPPELRKGFGLPTYEYQDAVWAYYFYRMISRAENVWMLVDSRSEGLKSGEESRYIKQLEYHFGVPLKRFVVRQGNMAPVMVPEIIKTDEDVARIKDTVLSATTLQNYLACPARFYFATVKGLSAEEEVAESLDYGMFGTVFHDTMRALYTSPSAMAEDFRFDHEGVNERGLTDRLDSVSRDYISQWLKREKDIKNKVKSLIISQLNAMEVTGRNLVIADVIVRYVMKTLQRDLELLEAEGVDSFKILGREIKVNGEFHGQKLKGFIDRLDSFRPDQARVVDYKTGKVLDDDEKIHDGNAEAIAEKIFARDVKDRPKIALQFFIYDMLLESHPQVQGRAIYNCIYSVSGLFKEPPLTVPCNEVFFNAVSERLEKLLDEMHNTEVPFRRTEDEKVCQYCDFKTICGK